MAQFLSAAVLISVFSSPLVAQDSERISSRTTPERAALEKDVREHPLMPFIRLARASRDSIAAVRDYEALFTKRELVGRTVYPDQMAMKFRQTPFSVYLKFIGKNQGREVIYVEGRNAGKLVAHEPPGTLRGFIGTIALDPNSSQARAEGRHPITQIGMLNMVQTLIQQWEAETQFGECEVQYYPDAKLKLPEIVECRVLESSHPTPRRQFKFQKSRLFIEKSTNFPIRVEQWGFPDRLHPEGYQVEEYTYSNIRPNVGLSDHDFDTRNPNYKF